MLLSAAAIRQCYISFSFVYVIPARLFPHLLCSCFSLRSQAHSHWNTHTRTHVQAWCSIAANLILLAIISCFDFGMLVEHFKRDYRNCRFPDTYRHIYQLNCIVVWARNNTFLFASTLIFKIISWLTTLHPQQTHARSTVLRKCYVFTQIHKVAHNILCHSHMIISYFVKLYFSIFVFEQFVLVFFILTSPEHRAGKLPIFACQDCSTRFRCVAYIDSLSGVHDVCIDSNIKILLKSKWTQFIN